MDDNCTVQPPDPGMRDFNLYLFLGLVIIACFCFGFFIFAKYRLRLERLRVRSVIPILGSFLAVLAIISTGVLVRAYAMPCSYRLIATLLVVPLLGVSAVIRLMIIVLLNRYALLLQVRLMEDLDEEEEEDELQQKKRGNWCCSGRSSILNTWRSIKSLIVISDEDFTRFTKQRRQETLRSLNSLRGFQGNVVLFCALLFPFVFGIVVIFIVRSDDIFASSGNCRTCRSVLNTSGYFIIACSVILIAFMLYAVFRLRTLVDPWGLRHELHWVLFFCHLLLLIYIIDSTVQIPPDSYFSTAIPLSLCALVILIIQTLYQIYVGWGKRIAPPSQNVNPQVHNLALYPPIYPFQFSKEGPNNGDDAGTPGHHPVGRPSNMISSGAQGGAGAGGNAKTTKNNKMVSTEIPTMAQQGSILLGSLLANADALGEFEIHLVAELSMEYLLFVKDCKKWKDHYPQLHPDLRLTRARRIYNQYIDQWGVYAIEFPNNISSEIAANLGRHKKQVASSSTLAAVATSENEVKISVFDDAVAYVSQLLETGALARFHHHQQQNNHNQESASKDIEDSPGDKGKDSSQSREAVKIVVDPPNLPPPRAPISSASIAVSSQLRASNGNDGRASNSDVMEDTIPV